MNGEIMTRRWKQFNNAEKRYLCFKLFKPNILMFGTAIIVFHLLKQYSLSIFFAGIFIIFFGYDIFKFVRTYNRLKKLDTPMFMEE